LNHPPLPPLPWPDGLPPCDAEIRLSKEERLADYLKRFDTDQVKAANRSQDMVVESDWDRRYAEWEANGCRGLQPRLNYPHRVAQGQKNNSKGQPA